MAHSPVTMKAFHPMQVWKRAREDTPESFREVVRHEIGVFFLRQVPCSAVLWLLHFIARRLGAFESHPALGVWLLAMAFTPAVWPGPWTRVTVAAFGAGNRSDGRLASRSYAIGVVFLLMAGFSFLCLGLFLYLLALVSMPKLFQ
jgi:hypothetical protein